MIDIQVNVDPKDKLVFPFCIGRVVIDYFIMN